jgi:archaellum component FlaC
VDRNYIDTFGHALETMPVDKKIVATTQEKFEHLKTSIKDAKLNIDSCQAEINNLCSHVLNRLFDSRPQIQRVPEILILIF